MCSFWSERSAGALPRRIRGRLACLGSTTSATLHPVVSARLLYRGFVREASRRSTVAAGLRRAPGWRVCANPIHRAFFRGMSDRWIQQDCSVARVLWSVCVKRRFHLKKKKSVAFPAVRLSPPHHIKGDHGPRGSAQKAHRWQNPGVFLLRN